MAIIKTVILFSFIIFFISCSKDNNTAYQLVTEFDPERDAAQDIERAIAEAQRSQRNILLDVGGVWCIWCHKLDKFFAYNPDISEFMHKNYVVLKINYSPENKNEAVLSKYPDIPGYPHFFVLDAQGKLLHSQGTGELEKGDHHDKQKMFDFLKKWMPGKRAEL